MHLKTYILSNICSLFVCSSKRTLSGAKNVSLAELREKSQDDIIDGVIGDVDVAQLYDDDGDVEWRGERTVDEIIADLRQIQEDKRAK